MVMPRNLAGWTCWLALAVGAVVMIFPIYWMFATAVRPHAEIFEAMNSQLQVPRQLWILWEIHMIYSWSSTVIPGFLSLRFSILPM